MPEFECAIENKVDSDFLKAYLECIAFAEQVPIGATVKFSDSLMERITADCVSFLESANLELCDLSQAGHDFWLTRNGHGCGFWDGDWEEATGKRLTKLSKSFGECFVVPCWEDGSVVKNYRSGQYKYNKDMTIVFE